MLVVGLIDFEHMQSVRNQRFCVCRGVCVVCGCVCVWVCVWGGGCVCVGGCGFLNCYYFSDLETQWPRNPELKSIFEILPVFNSYQRGMSQYWRKKKVSGLSQSYLQTNCQENLPLHSGSVQMYRKWFVFLQQSKISHFSFCNPTTSVFVICVSNTKAIKEINHLRSKGMSRAAL